MAISQHALATGINTIHSLDVTLFQLFFSYYIAVIVPLLLTKIVHFRFKSNARRRASHDLVLSVW